MTYENDSSASSQLRQELWNMIVRYDAESDITAYQILGCLEVLKIDVINALERANTDSK